MTASEKIYVIGHKNPDTDSICSAICYAALKHQIDGREYIASRAGQINNETQFVLDMDSFHRIYGMLTRMMAEMK